ncbi:MAG: GNAT family N-acetyltransferase [Paracoccaceae bacterium]
MMSIRKADHADAPRCQLIAEEAYPPYLADIGRRPMPMDQDFREGADQDQLWVAEIGDAAIGYIVAYAQGAAWMLENIADAHHRQGVGKALIAFVETLARQDKAEAVELYTDAKMTNNLALYSALGYLEVGRARQKGFDRVFFRKSL